jgi:hypothetical protein
MDGPPKAMCQASKYSYHDEDLLLLKTSTCQRVAPRYHALAPQDHDVKLKSGTFFPSWENSLASKGWARSSKSSSRSSKSDLSHLACGPLAFNLLACSPMETQARLVLQKLSTN